MHQATTCRWAKIRIGMVNLNIEENNEGTDADYQKQGGTKTLLAGLCLERCCDSSEDEKNWQAAARV